MPLILSYRLLAVLACASSLSAAQFTMNNASINGALNGAGGTASYSGTNPNLGYIGDGGYDAFDGYGFLGNLGSLTVVRQTDTFATQNTVRWLDIFTNPTAGTITQAVQFYGDLGSDGTTVTVASVPGVITTRDNGNDPVIAHVMGSNGTGVTLSHGIISRLGLPNNDAAFSAGATDDYLLTMNITLAAGQSLGVMHFVGLARDTAAVRPFAADQVLAQSMGNNLLSNPLLTGLTQAQLNTVRNFVVPEPATLALLAIAGSGLAVLRRRRQAGAALT